jgi:ATP-dependent Clp protease ATP-binding subunit ClpA
MLKFQIIALEFSSKNHYYLNIKLRFMSKKNETNYTIELNGVLDYMSTVLLNEFPTDVLTPEYLILAILDTRDCHANLILDNCLMSNNLDELRKVYVEVIDEHTNPQMKDGNVRFNDELMRILECAKNESEKLNNSQIGTEHVLLAVLNKENNFK